MSTEIVVEKSGEENDIIGNDNIPLTQDPTTTELLVPQKTSTAMSVLTPFAMSPLGVDVLTTDCILTQNTMITEEVVRLESVDINPTQIINVDDVTLNTNPVDDTIDSKCIVCRSRLYRENCTRQACSLCCNDDECEDHRIIKRKAQLKAQILEGKHYIQQHAAQIRSNHISSITRRLLPIREPNIVYQGETVVIWDIREYAKNKKWRDNAVRKSLRRRRTKTTINNENNVYIRNNLKRFYNICEKRYQDVCRYSSDNSDA